MAYESCQMVIQHEVASKLYKIFLDSVEMRTLCKEEPKRNGKEYYASYNGERLMQGIRNENFLSALPDTVKRKNKHISLETSIAVSPELYSLWAPSLSIYIVSFSYFFNESCAM